MITHVSDTARWVAIYRALESERPDALFRDPWARRLGGERGEAIMRAMGGARVAWPMIVRTAVLDEIVMRLAAAGDIDAVVNLAAGLDVRPFRLGLPPSLRWIDVDFTDVLDYKRGVLGDARASCRYEARPADLADPEQRRAVLAGATAGARSALVVSEGLLIYLEPAQVADLARDLAAQPACRWWLTDLGSPELLRWMTRRWGRHVAAGNAPFRFAPAEGTGFFVPHGWREAEWHVLWDEARRLGRRMRFARVFDVLIALQSRARRERTNRFAGYALLARG